MGINLETRLEKLEAATGINDPCGKCELQAATAKKFFDFLVAHGIEMKKPKRSDIEILHCPSCGAERELDCTGADREERDVEKRINQEEIACCKEGRLPSEEIVRLAEWLFERRAIRGRALFGPIFDEARAHCGYTDWQRGFENWKRVNFPQQSGGGSV